MADVPSCSVSGDGRETVLVLDEVLTTRSRSGDLKAFTALLQRYDNMMQSVAWRLLGDRDAMDDALQDAYLKAYRQLDNLKDDRSFASWLYRIVETTCIDTLRREIRRRHEDIDDYDELAAAGPDPSELAVQRGKLSSFLELLSAEQREVVVLVLGVGLSHNEVAEMLDIAPGTVGSRLNRARSFLVEETQRYEDDRD